MRIKKTTPEAKLPKFAYPGDAGADVYSVDEYTLYPHEQHAFDTGLAIETPRGYETQVRPKSGLALNHGITIVNTPGTVDAQYRGKLLVILINHSDVVYHIKKGDKIAQICVRAIEEVEFIEAEELTDTDRGEGGFGSTGKS